MAALEQSSIGCGSTANPQNDALQLVFGNSMVYISLFGREPMPKPNLSSASVDALLKLRDEIEEVLAHRAALLGIKLAPKGKLGEAR